MQAIRLDPSGGGITLPGRAPPLRASTPWIGTGEPPLIMLAGRRLVLAALHADRLAQRDGRPGIAGFALAVDPLVVVAHVQGGRLGGKAECAASIRGAA